MSVYFKNTGDRLHPMQGSRPLPVANRSRLTNSEQPGHCVKNPALHQPLPRMMMIFLWAILHLGVTIAHAQENIPQDSPSGIVVLDPGHGGNDVGARGSENMTEKQVVMTLAEAMTKRLKKTYNVVLTRKDDYQIGVFERTALANHIKADLFVSIHAGGSFGSVPRGMSLLYYDGTSNNTSGSDTLAPDQTRSPGRIKPWEQNRPELVEKSRYITELLRMRLTQADKDLKLTSMGAPLVVMSGADMPGVMIEIGTLTNPLDAKALKDGEHISNLARVICDAIDDFFSNELRL